MSPTNISSVQLDAMASEPLQSPAKQAENGAMQALGTKAASTQPEVASPIRPVQLSRSRAATDASSVPYAPEMASWIAVEQAANCEMHVRPTSAGGGTTLVVCVPTKG